jgi:hypothetical protein
MYYFNPINNWMLSLPKFSGSTIELNEIRENINFNGDDTELFNYIHDILDNFNYRMLYIKSNLNINLSIGKLFMNIN